MMLNSSNATVPAVPGPFIAAQNPLKSFDLVKAATYEILHGALSAAMNLFVSLYRSV